MDSFVSIKRVMDALYDMYLELKDYQRLQMYLKDTEYFKSRQDSMGCISKYPFYASICTILKEPYINKSTLFTNIANTLFVSFSRYDKLSMVDWDVIVTNKDGSQHTIHNAPLWIISNTPTFFNIYHKNGIADFEALIKETGKCICDNGLRTGYMDAYYNNIPICDPDGHVEFVMRRLI